MYNQDNKYNYEEYLNNNNNTIKTNKNKIVKRKSLIITIVIFIVIVLLFFIFLGKTNLFFNNNSIKTTNNSNSNIQNDKNFTEIKYNTISFDKLAINIPTTLKETEKNSNYLIYSSDDYSSSLAIIKTEKDNFKDINSLIEALLESDTSKTSKNYDIVNKDINGEKWNYVLTSIKIKDYVLDEYIYTIVKNNYYYVINYQVYHDSENKNYIEIIEKSLNFK